MKSPFTGNDAIIEIESRTLEYRKESFTILYNYYLCEDTNEQFTTTELDTANLNQVYNQYRVKYGIPFVDEIKAIREHYNLSAAKMSEVLGLGANVYRAYEAGEMPSIATGRLIQLAKNPREFRNLLNLCRNEIEPNEYERILKKIDHSMNGWSLAEEIYETRILGPRNPTVFTGYRVPNIEKIGRMVQYFAQVNKPFKTMLNKLLFYADFLHYRRTSYGITGMTYKAIQLGPVPYNYGGLYDDIIEKKYVNIRLVDFGEYEGEQFYNEKPIEPKIGDNLFTESEQKAIADTANRFESYKTKHIVEASHDEHAWRLNVDENNRIKYDFGFYLKNVE